MSVYRKLVIIMFFILLFIVFRFVITPYFRDPIVNAESGKGVIDRQDILARADYVQRAELFEPSSDSVSDADQYLFDGGMGLSITVGRSTIFYPYQLLVWHPVINDVWNGVSLLITYDPLCNTGRVFEREVYEKDEKFRVTDKIWNSAGFIEDETTKSLWSPLLGRALFGDRAQTHLVPYFSELITWETFKRSYPSGRVLARPDGFENDYTFNPFKNYQNSQTVSYPVTSLDARLDAKTMIYGTEDPTIASLTYISSAIPSYWFCWAAVHPDTEVIQ